MIKSESTRNGSFSEAATGRGVGRRAGAIPLRDFHRPAPGAPGRAVVAFQIAAALAAAFAGTAIGQVAPVSVVVMSGDPAPGTGAGVTYSTLASEFAIGVPFMNNTGRIAFLSGLSGAGVTAANDRGVWVGTPGALQLLSREGAAAPDSPAGVVYGTLNEMPMLGGAASVAFRAVLEGTGVTGTDDDALFAGSFGAMTLAAREGFFAPGPPLSTYASFLRAAVSQSTTLAYTGNFGTGVTGIWYGIPGSITNVVRVGEQAPGMPIGVNYGTLMTDGLTPVLVNSAGQIVHRVLVGGPGIGAANDDILYGGTPGSTHIVARAGNPAPGGGTWGTFIEPVLTDSGAVAFRGFLAGAPAASDFGVYRTIILGVMDRVAIEGAAAPGTPAVFGALDNLVGSGNGVPRMNNAHGVAFRAGLTGTGVTAANDIGVWGHNDVGALVLLLRESDALAAAGAGVTVNTIAAGPPALNGANRVAVRVTLAGTGVHFGNDEAILARNGVGDLVLALREGQIVDIPGSGPGTILTVPGVVGPGVQNGASTMWTDDCRLLVRAQHDGRVGLFISDVNATCRAVVTAQPDPVVMCPTGTGAFSVTAAGTGPFTYQWQIQTAPNTWFTLFSGPASIPCGSTITGAIVYALNADTPSVTIRFVQPCPGSPGQPQHFQFRGLVTNACGTTTSNEATYTICPADFNCSRGPPTVADIFAFLSAWFAGNPSADFNGSGGAPTVQDIFAFLTAWFAGC